MGRGTRYTFYCPLCHQGFDEPLAGNVCPVCGRALSRIATSLKEAVALRARMGSFWLEKANHATFRYDQERKVVGASEARRRRRRRQKAARAARRAKPGYEERRAQARERDAVRDAALPELGDYRMWMTDHPGYPLGNGMPGGETMRMDGESHSNAWRRILRGDVCAYCDAPDSGTVDHVEPRSRGSVGREHWPNLVGACEPCNRAKAADPLLMFLLKRRGLKGPVMPGPHVSPRPPYKAPVMKRDDAERVARIEADRIREKRKFRRAHVA